MMSSRARVQAPAVLDFSADPADRVPWDEVPEVDIESPTVRSPQIQIYDPRESVAVSSSSQPVQRIPEYIKPNSVEARSSTLQSNLSLSKDINQMPSTPILQPPAPPIPPRNPPEFFRSSASQLQTREPQEASLQRLRDSVRDGNWESAENCVLLLLAKIQARDVDAVLGVIGGDKDTLASQPNSVTSEATTVVASKEADEKANTPMIFSPYITVVEPKRTGDYVTEQISSGLTVPFNEDQNAREDAKNLLAVLQPLMCNASKNRRGMNKESALLTPETHDVDIPSLRDLVIAVSRHATRATQTEPRMLEIELPCYVLGDIHGNLADLEFFARTLWPAGADAAAGNFLFLGDFVDRGKDSVAVAAYVMAMKVLHPKKWLAIRGNHETREVNGNVDHYQDGSFLRQCSRLFGEADGNTVWEAVNEYFDVLPLAAIIDDRIFCVHGGIPATLNEPGASLAMIEEVECPLRSAQHNRLVYDMLWSDPATPEQERGDMDEGGFGLSPRGCACFGEASIEAFLAKYKLQHIFRGHEAQKMGVGVSKGNRLTTIFSTSKDHFQGDPTATCGCVLVEGDSIKPIVRCKSHSASLSLVPTYVGQSVEATELSVLQADHRVLHAQHSSVHNDYGAASQYASYAHYQHQYHSQCQSPYQAVPPGFPGEDPVKYVAFQPAPAQPQSWPAQSHYYRVQGRQY